MPSMNAGERRTPDAAATARRAAMRRNRSGLAALAAVAALGLAGARAAADSAVPLDAAIARYRSVLVQDVERTVAGASSLRARVAANDLAGARQAWLEARVGWERSEVFTGGFVPDLDRDIDAWPNGATGFHAIETKLFGVGQTDVADEVDALLQNLGKLNGSVHSVALTPQGLLNGVTRLAYEVGESKIDGGESRVSGTSLDDMRNNVAGIDLAWRTIFAAAVAARDPALAAETQRRIDALKTMLEQKDLRRLDPDRLRAASEQLVLALQSAAPRLALERPTLE
ncbi:MAG: EfeM/EfeO family lipoprotein [Xanthobacteraceae bacterium]